MRVRQVVDGGLLVFDDVHPANRGIVAGARRVEDGFRELSKPSSDFRHAGELVHLDLAHS